MEITIAKISGVKPDKNGDPISNILTSENKWLNCMGIDLTGKVGAVIEIEKLRQFPVGKNSWYCNFKALLSEPGHEPGSPKKAAPGASVAQPAPFLNGSGKLTFDEYVLAVKAAHRLAMDVEPDSLTTQADHSQARAALVNTFIIALTNGKVGLPTEDDAVPF